jgi:hypothetical protein
MRLGWYVNRLRRMSAAELAGRLTAAARQRHWAAPARRPDGLATLLAGARKAAIGLRRDQAPAPSAASRAAIAAADGLLAGHWPIFHLDAAIGDPPDWFTDPLTGRRAPPDGYAFRLPHRDEAKVGNIKFVWEMSRHQAATLLASAWWLTGDNRYAERAAAQLRSWWQDNPFLTGIHWSSGIEVGLRLLSWSWMRALLADWPGVRALFDDNPVFAAQLYHHQIYARRFHSLGSSANNHLVAELAGLAASAAAFPWFAESAGWAEWAGAGLAHEAGLQTHGDGWNREQASEYHVFVFEMLAAASLASRLSGRPLPPAINSTLCGMADAWAAALDAAGRPPRFGDGDEGRGVLLDSPLTEPSAILLDVARALFGAASWWPAAGGSVLGHVAALTVEHAPPGRETVRPSHFPDAGVTILRSGAGSAELWLRCDSGPHGFLSIAAHGHADALSVELRCGGVEVLADPGTYCYHGEPEWRAYFKGTAGHNTLRIADADQAVSGGPFLWLTRPVTTIEDVGPLHWQAHHDGYDRLPGRPVHHRRVGLDAGSGVVTIEDWLESSATQTVALSWHLGPSIDLRLDGTTAQLAWPGGNATLTLPALLTWTAHRGEEAPPLGWYSGGFGRRQPSWVLVGRGMPEAQARLTTVFSPLREVAA